MSLARCKKQSPDKRDCFAIARNDKLYNYDAIGHYMTYQPQDILEAARSIRPYLSELLDSQEAQTLDRQLAELIAQAQENPTDVSKHILKQLLSNSKTREWTLKFLKHKPPSEKEKSYQPIPGSYTSYQPPPGDRNEPIPGFIKYNCPICQNYPWYQSKVGEPIPNCPIHNCPLEKV